ncbi:universal stress protein, partial [Natroniella sulfidigena]|uniref:universal stress protein n=1 Tax=Natroniella sulfidigena TaxID=723921 RepID=UPI00200A9D72
SRSLVKSMVQLFMISSPLISWILYWGVRIHLIKGVLFFQELFIKNDATLVIERVKFEFFESVNSVNPNYKEREKELLRKEKEKIEKLGLDVKTSVLVGSPADKIVETAESEGVDLILMASQGKGYIKELLLGSITFNVIRTSNVPVLIEKHTGVKEKIEVFSNNKFKKVLVPINTSKLSEKLFDKVKSAKGTIKNLVLLSVIEQITNQDKLNKIKKSTKERLEELKVQLEEEEINVETKVKVGIASQNILKVAQKEDVSLIMMPTTGAGKLREIMIGSTANAVIRNSKRDLMVFPSASLLTPTLKQGSQMKLLKKSNKLVSELMSFYFELGIKEVQVDVEHKPDEVITCIQGQKEDLSSDKVDELDDFLNTARVTQVEEYYWELVGESNRSTELSLIGMITDKAEIEYEDDILKVKIYMSHK